MNDHDKHFDKLEENKEKINKLVQEWMWQGLPKPIPRGEKTWVTLSEKQQKILLRIEEQIDAEMIFQHAFFQDKKMISEEKMEQWICQCEKLWAPIRVLLQEAILDGLIHLYFIQDYARSYGVIPLPESQWKCYILRDHRVCCWKCDGGIAIVEGKFICEVCDTKFPEIDSEIKIKLH